MNERIKELANKIWSLDIDPNPHFQQCLEEFAELIVRECMAQVQQVREIKAGHAGPEYTQGFDDGMFVAISTIEEHFGVKE